ncbi:PEP-utilizing enzyme [Sphaerisporangium sp. NBC_01403]|uniref:PEP-utilizing enzyme n=1 Tax=Sphaerisporangium sp. NBC_01403 TaxID=2903599 RepID=UPI0032565827
MSTHIVNWLLPESAWERFLTDLLGTTSAAMERASALMTPNASILRRGIPLVPGLGSGPVLHLTTANAHTLRPSDATGAVIVCGPLGPEAVLVLSHQPSAIVATTGGPLSHTAILAREFGIPCITAVANALTIPRGSPRHRRRHYRPRHLLRLSTRVTAYREQQLTRTNQPYKTLWITWEVVTSARGSGTLTNFRRKLADHPDTPIVSEFLYYTR